MTAPTLEETDSVRITETRRQELQGMPRFRPRTFLENSQPFRIHELSPRFRQLVELAETEENPAWPSILMVRELGDDYSTDEVVAAFGGRPAVFSLLARIHYSLSRQPNGEEGIIRAREYSTFWLVLAGGHEWSVWVRWEDGWSLYARPDDDSVWRKGNRFAMYECP